MSTAVGPLLRSLLDRYGLSSLAGWLSERIIKNTSEEQILLELYDRPEFKRAFPEIEARRKAAAATGLAYTPISAEDVLTYRTQARELMRSYGLPPALYQQDADFFDLIVNDVSVDELQWRLDSASKRVVDAAPEVRQTFTELFGADGPTALFTLFVDPDRAPTHLENMIQQAEMGGAARRFGFNPTPAEMSRLAGYNFTYEEATRGFSELDQSRGLFEETLMEIDDLDAEVEGIEATFGLDSDSASAVRRRAEGRVAATAGQSGGGSDERGPTGLGGAGRR